MYTKLRVFELEEFDKVVYIDADMLVCADVEELFNQPHMSAVVSAIDSITRTNASYSANYNATGQYKSDKASYYTTLIHYENSNNANNLDKYSFNKQ